jgi:hypothetical protein
MCKRVVMSSLFGLLIAGPVLATNVVITAFQGNGEVTWETDTTNLNYCVQWAPALSAPVDWSCGWDALTYIKGGTNLQFSAAVPMFYRILAGASDALGLEGAWYVEDDLGHEGPMVLTREGIALSGTFDSDGHVVGYAANGSNVVWSVNFAGGGGGLRFDGVVSSNVIEGTVLAYWDMSTTGFTATK